MLYVIIHVKKCIIIDGGRKKWKKQCKTKQCREYTYEQNIKYKIRVDKN